MIPEPNPHIDPVEVDEPLPGSDAVQRGHDTFARAIAPVLAAVTEFGCLATVQIAPTSDRIAIAIAIAALHEARGAGMHTLIDSGLEHGDLEAVGLGDRVRQLAEPAEIALPGLVAAGAEFDCAVLVRQQAFDCAFRDFLYLDRLLRPEALLILDGASHAVASALAEFIHHARAYECRSRRDSELLILRKLGDQRSARSVTPARWSSVGDREPAGTQAGTPGTGPNTVRPAGSAGNGRDATLDTAPTRELHLAWARVRDLESRVADLGTRLVDAEQRAAGLLRIQFQLAQLERVRQQPAAARRNPIRVAGLAVRDAGRRVRGRLGR